MTQINNTKRVINRILSSQLTLIQGKIMITENKTLQTENINLHWFFFLEMSKQIFDVMFIKHSHYKVYSNDLIRW